MPGGRATSLSAESIYNFFAERMWRPSVLHWIGWPAAVACFVGALAGMFWLGTYVIGLLLLLLSLGLAGYMLNATVRRSRLWQEHIDAARRQIERLSDRPDSALCLVQHAGLGMTDRILLVKEGSLRFKGYLMPPREARRAAGASGIAYVDAAKIISGVVPLTQIQRYEHNRGFRRLYGWLAVIGLGCAAALVPELLSKGAAWKFALPAFAALLIAGTVGGVLLFVRRQPQFLLHTSEYALAVLANYPDPDTVRRFLHRLGYREIAGRPVKPAPPEAESPKT